VKSLRAIAAGLEERGIPAARGGRWSAVQVARLLGRLPSLSTVQAPPPHNCQGRSAAQVEIALVCPLIEANRPLVLHCGNACF
jgi:hypothetical protein